MLQFPAWKITLVLVLCLLGISFAAPNLGQDEWNVDGPGWLPGKKVSLGLDLQGGSHLLLKVDVDVVVRERLDAIVEVLRRELRKARIGYRELGVKGGAAGFVLRKPEDREKALEIVRSADQSTEAEIDDSGRARAVLTEQALADLKTSALQQSIEIVRRRIDETGVREPTIQRQGEDRILVQLPGIDDPERIKALLGKTAKMTFRLVDITSSAADAAAGRVPPGSVLMPADNPGPGEQASYVVKRRVMVSGDRLVDAQPGFDQRSGEAIVSFRFDAVGGKRFGKVTSENVNRPFAIVLDNKVISAPVIREPILGGSGQISGNFTVASARDLALLLRAGALPAPLTVLEERTVGPGLGSDSIDAGKLASIIGLILVLVFMTVAYGLFGLMADLAVLINIGLIIGALSALQATLTLPGIAGIVLTIGMAVDANVLIFERIREEMDLGRTPMAAIEAGYKRALTTIIDSNLTTLFAAMFLYSFGSGPIKGFAVTLAIGIVTSMFTAIMLTRMLIVIWLRRRKPDALPI
ncbi:MAG: protein translocase subunit SecD [Rhodospirillaceae bacterium]|jgi:preprotein translocase subunit SecD|nr:protein translocase subunit SecD [Rhodospirillaceae bacterium]